ncbi:HxHSH motif-containing lipoprotein [Metamycoplasma canadense]|uniref:Lipoprotein n=1 Tax=Metamycoplasma canadense TaxID=29554 RepID=A0A077L6Z5_9BACT|nr:hypothetical protein [Metamycoplasma canadense]BAP39797.1 hypothetical protein MCAN360_0779 [Metamycoplasma canadense]
MKKNNLLKFILPSVSIFNPLIVISCVNYPNDNENLSFTESNLNIKKDIEINLKNDQTKKIKDIYLNKILKLFISIKETYRNFRKDYYWIIRKIDSFREKVQSLIIDQGKKENSEQIKHFFDKWLNEDSNKRPELSLLLDKYKLIFQDADAVLNDVNLVFDNQQFIKFIEIIDKRLSGIDINIGMLQKAILDSWGFLKNNLYSEENISKIENLNKINIESDKNSHSHSHAIVNLMFEMGLWHTLLKNIVLQKDKLNEFKHDFLIMKENVIDNIGQKNYEADFDFIINIFENKMEFNEKNNLLNKDFQIQSKLYLDEIKKILLEISKSEGIENNINLK